MYGSPFARSPSGGSGAGSESGGEGGGGGGGDDRISVIRKKIQLLELVRMYSLCVVGDLYVLQMQRIYSTVNANCLRENFHDTVEPLIRDPLR